MNCYGRQERQRHLPDNQRSNNWDCGKRQLDNDEQYIDSQDWQDRRARIKPKECAGCSDTQRLQLHHRTYPEWGAPLEAFINQDDEDFTWLCPTCHSAISAAQRKKRKGG